MILIAWESGGVILTNNKHFACLRNRESRMIKSKIKNPIPLLYFFSMAQWPITRKTFHRLRHDTKSDRFCKIMIT